MDYKYKKNLLTLSLMTIQLHIVFLILAVSVRLALCLMVLKDKTVQDNALSWVLMMILFPWAGLILYLIFGKDFRSEIDRQFIHAESLRRFKEEIPAQMGAKLFQSGNEDKLEPDFRPLAKLLSACGEGNRVFEGNTIERITSGARKKELLMADIEAARKSIHLEYFRFGNDDSGTQVRDLLARKAAEGVEVRFLLNSLVARKIPRSFWEPLKDAGAQVISYTSISQGLRLLLMRLNCQQHRKIVVIDGRIGYTGGMNINDNYFNLWQDAHVRIEGPAVARLQASFLDTWLSCMGSVEKPLSEYFEPVMPAPEGKLLQIVTDEADFPWLTTQMAYEWVLGNAKDYVYFQTPYFVPPTSFLIALKAAALRGVDVRVMLSQKVDTPIMGPLNRSYYSECLEAGVKILEAGGEFTHAKTLVADDYVSVVGATNLDVRSFEINSEVNTFIYDRQTALECKKDFLSRTEGAISWTVESWKKSRTALADLGSRLVRLLYMEF